MRRQKLLLLLIPILSTFLISFSIKGIVLNSDFILNIYPSHELLNYLSSWDSISLLGIGNTINSTYIFPFSLVYLIFSNFFTQHIGQAIIFSIFLNLGFFAFYFFISQESKSFTSNYLSSLFYVLNMYVILNLEGSLILLIPYFVLPLQLILLRKVLERTKLSLFYIFAFAFSVLIMGGTNPPFAVINLIIIVFYFGHLYTNNQVKFNTIQLVRVFSITFLFTILVNLYWIIGVVIYYLSMRASALQGIVGGESYEMGNMATSYLNVFRTLGLWSFGGGVNNTPYFNYSSIYSNISLFTFSLFIIPIAVLIGLFFLKERIKKYIFILALLVIVIPLEVGTNQGLFKDIYLWVYTHIPFFAMFRNGYKFAQIYLFALSFFLAIVLSNIRNRMRRNVLSVGIFIVILVNAFPFFTGRLFEASKQIAGIPSYYYSAQKFFAKDQTNHRILLLPQQYFAEYTWGYTEGNPEIIWGKGLVARQPGSPTQNSNNILSLELYKALINSNYQQANMLMKNLNVKYIVQRNDFAWYDNKKDFSSPASIAAVLKPYKKIQTFGKLDVYELQNNSLNTLFTGGNIIFKQISPIEYQLEIKNLKNPIELRFLESYHKDWKLYPAKGNISCSSIAHYPTGITECAPQNEIINMSNIAYVWHHSLFENTHKIIYGYANQWVIDPSVIKRLYPKSYTTNKDGSINIRLSLFFVQQSYMEIGYVISGGVIIISLIFILWQWRRREEKRK